MTLPLTLIVITGEIDLSVASILGLSSALVGVSRGATAGRWRRSSPPSSSVGVAAGAFNGLLVTRVGLPSLAVTIGTLTLYRGIAIVILGPNTISNFPASYTSIGINPVGRTFLSWSVVIFLVLAVVFGVVLHFTPFGRSLYAIGANQEAALFAGIRVKRIKLLLFVLSGVICCVRGHPLHLPPLDRGAGQRARPRAERRRDRAARRRLDLRRQGLDRSASCCACSSSRRCRTPCSSRTSRSARSGSSPAACCCSACWFRTPAPSSAGGEPRSAGARHVVALRWTRRFGGWTDEEVTKRYQLGLVAHS